MNELQISVQLEEGRILTNASEVKKRLEERYADLKTAVFTEESKSILKAELADVRKVRKAFDDRRKEVKEHSMRPYKAFEKEAKEVLAVFDETIENLNSQLKEIEEVRIQKKKSEIEAVYKNIVQASGVGDFLLLNSIYNRKWENASTTIKAVKEEMQGIVDKAVSELNIIQGMQSDVKEEAVELYKKTRNLTAAMAHINTYESNKAKALAAEEERRKAEEERRLRAEIERAREAEARHLRELEEARQELETKAPKEPDEEPEGFLPEDSDELPFEQPVTITAFYRVVATPEELEQVEMAFNSIGIYFERRDA